MLRLLWLRWLARALRKQEDGLRAELAGVEYMLSLNAEKQRQVNGRLTMMELERRAPVRY